MLRLLILWPKSRKSAEFFFYGSREKESDLKSIEKEKKNKTNNPIKTLYKLKRPNFNDQKEEHYFTFPNSSISGAGNTTMDTRCLSRLNEEPLSFQ